MSAAFERRGEIVRFSPTRLAAVDTVYAMTVHKSQGSQFDTAAVLLPGPTSQILTRELLYTAVTRARERLVLVGTEEAIRAAVARPVARASGVARAAAVGKRFLSSRVESVGGLPGPGSLGTLPDLRSRDPVRATLPAAGRRTPR
ncbi:MAG: ATP-dependent RecD-like DNA helicase [Thermoleophilaceae bacterium]